MATDTSTSQTRGCDSCPDQVILPTQSPLEVAIELQDYDREDVERLYQAVWPGRTIMANDGDLNTETAANMSPEVRHAFTNGGIDAAVDAATDSNEEPGGDDGE